MNWDRVKGNWKQFTGKVKEKWGKLTDDDLTAIAGRRDQLAGKLLALTLAQGGSNMFRRLASLTRFIPLAVLGWMLSARPAAAQFPGYPPWAGAPYVAPVVPYDWYGIESLYRTYWWGSMLIQTNSAAARGDGDYSGPFDLPADSKRQTALATLRRYGGGLNWPVGLRGVMPREEMNDLRGRMDSVVELLLHQPASDRPNAELVAELTANLDKVRKRFALYAADSAMTAQQEADARRFLGRMQDAIRSLDDRPKLVTTRGN